MNKKTISIRLSEETHRQLKQLAEADHRTVSAYIECLVLKVIKNK